MYYSLEVIVGSIKRNNLKYATHNSRKIYDRKHGFSVISWYKKHQLISSDGIPADFVQPFQSITVCLLTKKTFLNQSELNASELVSCSSAYESRQKSLIVWNYQEYRKILAILVESLATLCQEPVSIVH